MSKFFITLFGMGKKSAADADNNLTKKLIAANPRLALQAELEKRRNTAQDWTERMVKAERALVEDQRETADAEAELARRESNLKGLQAKLEGADADGKIHIMRLATAESEKFVRAQATLERERSEDALKARTLEQVKKGHKLALSAVEKLENEMDSMITRLEAAQAETDAAKLEKVLNDELTSLSDPSSDSSVAIAALEDLVTDAQDELAVLQLSGKTSTPTDHDAAVKALLAGEEASEPVDPFAVLGNKKKTK